MLKLQNIKKFYKMGDQKVEALKGINLEFRKNEFVAILGQSGCGKTTLLNIIGGLDRYSSGNLIINNRSTKEYKDKDWDTYRNHSIGFIFQSYNLIPHQTVLENVELALTLSGIKKEERRKRAIKVLEKVGLKDKLSNKPNQLSGGQMQRVAIARALVNDPEIILADEPTGALDSKTSVQIMELLKEISKDKLIIMVTHNPELAVQYTSRIVKLLDGKVVDDSNPIINLDDIKNENDKIVSLTDDKDLTKTEIKKKNKKKRMSFFTAMFLSFKNLLTKKGRTILVSFAGSIGIIGIALILAISSGFSTYINKMQEDTLGSYPITISAKNIDYTSIIMSMFSSNSNSDKVINHEKDGVYNKDTISKLINNVGVNLKANNLKKFKEYIENNYQEIKSSISAIQYSYEMDTSFYKNITDLENDGVENIQPNSNALLQMILKYSIFYFENDSNLEIKSETISGKKTGNYIIKAKENSNSNFLKSFESTVSELTNIKKALFENNTSLSESDANNYITPKINETTIINSNTVLLLAFQLIGFGNMINQETGNINASGFSLMSNSDIFYEMIDNEELLKSQYTVLAKQEGKDIFDKLGKTNHSDALLVLDKNNEVDEYILYALGLMTDEQMDSLLKGMVTNNNIPTKIDYNSIIGTEYKVLDEADYFVFEGEGENQSLIDFRIYNDKNDISKYIKYLNYYKNAIKNTTNSVKIVGIVKLNDNTTSGFLESGVAYTKYFTEQLISYHNQKIDENSLSLTKIDSLTPSKIFMYVSSFEAKDNVKSFIETYNKNADNGDEITYTDTADLIMSTVSTIINAITYVLIAFVSVSLIVSSIMIGIITYISVIERTKEIGVLRSIGASKKDVKRVFTAESFIIGLTSGAFGIIISILLTIPINVLLKNFTGIAGLASLPILSSIILVLISIVLTLISGLIPAHSASKKDPVIALRTE